MMEVMVPPSSELMDSLTLALNTCRQQGGHEGAGQTKLTHASPACFVPLPLPPCHSQGPRTPLTAVELAWAGAKHLPPGCPSTSLPPLASAINQAVVAATHLRTYMHLRTYAHAHMHTTKKHMHARIHTHTSTHTSTHRRPCAHLLQVAQLIHVIDLQRPVLARHSDVVHARLCEVAPWTR